MAEAEAEAIADGQPEGNGEAPEAFELPAAVAEAFRNGDLAIFAGAGVGIDAAFPFTLAEDVMAELGLEPGEEGMAFPDVMSAYEQKHGRMALLERIKERLDYVRSFPELTEAAGRFHRALSSAFTVTDFYTTDWDDLFERECGAMPFAAERDWAFWRLGGRKVFRIHGSIASPASIIATDADYSQCYRGLDSSIVWEKLETMLATKTVAFVGYRFRDTDFNAMCGAFDHRMQELLERCYVVSLDPEDPSEIASRMHILRTDPLTFVERLKACYHPEVFVADERFEAISDFREDVRMEREQMLAAGELREDGEMLLAAAYQDGLIHACEHIEANRPAGRYSSREHVDAKLEMYRSLRHAKLEAGEYEDVAYIEGYGNGLAFLVSDDAGREATPLYFVAGHDGPLATHDQFRAAVADAASLDPAAHEHAAKRAAALGAGAEYRHSTFIF